MQVNTNSFPWEVALLSTVKYKSETYCWTQNQHPCRLPTNCHSCQIKLAFVCLLTSRRWGRRRLSPALSLRRPQRLAVSRRTKSFLLEHAWHLEIILHVMYIMQGCHLIVILRKSQPAKNRNLSRLFSNLSRLKKKPSTCAPRNLPCLVFESSNTFLTCTWPRQTGQQHSSFF